MAVFLLQDDLKACPGTEILCPTLLKYLKSGKSLKRLRRILIDEHRLEPDTMIVKSTSCQLVVVGGDKYTACLACQDLRNVVNQSGGGEKNEGIVFLNLAIREWPIKQSYSEVNGVWSRQGIDICIFEKMRG